MSVTDELVRNNDSYVRSFKKGDLPLPPAKHVAVLACMDARLDVHKILGLQEGDAHVIRNAGGGATDDAISSHERSIASRICRLSASRVTSVPSSTPTVRPWKTRRAMTSRGGAPTHSA